MSWNCNGLLGSILCLWLALPAGYCATIFAENFNTGSLPAGWTTSGFGGSWSITSLCPASTPGCSSGDYAYYGDTGSCEYVDGDAELTSPVINLPLDQTITLNCSRHDAPPPPPPGGMFGPPSALVRVYYDLGTGFWSGDDVVTTNDGIWETRTVDLTLYAGQSIQLAFSFSAFMTGISGLGWQVDNILVADDSAGPILSASAR